MGLLRGFLEGVSSVDLLRGSAEGPLEGLISLKPSQKLYIITRISSMEVEKRARVNILGEKRDMNFQARLFPDEILVMARRNRYFLQDS